MDLSLRPTDHRIADALERSADALEQIATVLTAAVAAMGQEKEPEQAIVFQTQEGTFPG